MDREEWMRSLMTECSTGFRMQHRIDAIAKMRRQCGVSQHDAVAALNAARDDFALACTLLPQVDYSDGFLS